MIRLARRFSTKPVLGLADLPTPPPDNPPYAPISTHINFWMKYGSQKRHELNQALYDIGDLVLVRFRPDLPQLFVFDPREMLKVHRASGTWPVGAGATLWSMKRFFELNAKNFNAVPFAVLSGAEWKRQRGAFQQGLFSFDDASSYTPLLKPIARDSAALLPQNKDDLWEFLNRSTFEMITTVMLGSRPNILDLTRAAPQDIEYVENASVFLSMLVPLGTRPSAAPLAVLDPDSEEARKVVPQQDLDDWKTAWKAGTRVMEIGMQKVEQLLERIKKQGASEDPNHVPSYLERLAKSESVTKAEMVVNTAGFIQAGVDTTASSILTTLVHLAKHPEEQEKLRQEVLQLPENYSWADVKALKLVPQFINEALRFNPAAGMHTRFPVEDVTLVSHRSGLSYNIPAGTVVSYAHQPISLDANIVSKAPDFDPKRWSVECKYARKGTAEAVIDHPLTGDFGWGPRMCVGARLADVEMRLYVIEVVRHHKLRLVHPNEKISYTSAVTQRPDPVPAIIFERVN